MSKDLVIQPGQPPVPAGQPALRQGARLSEAQIDYLVGAASKMAGDLGEIAKDVVAIYRIRAEAGADVERAEAATRHLVAAARAEIERLVHLESHTRTRGQVVVDIIRAITGALQAIPDVDGASRHALVDSLRYLAEAALKE